MGGFFSGKGMRYNKTSTRIRLYPGEVPSIDIRDIKHVGLQGVRIALEVVGIRSEINFKRHSFKTGGVWHTFECPSCRKGRFKLYYLRSGSIGCHKCLNLAYPSENRGKADRACRMKWKYIRQIAGEGSNDCQARPKGMHRKTYDRLMGKVSRYDQEAWSRFMHM